MTQKGKRARITPKGLGIIMDMALAQPRIARTTLAEDLQAALKKAKQDVPEIEVIERKISWFRNHAVDNPEDQPWSISTMDSLPIPPGALPVVLQEYRRAIDAGRVFTLRWAKWVSRLSAPELAEYIHQAEVIARAEQISELMRETFDASDFDELLAGFTRFEDHGSGRAVQSVLDQLPNDPTKKRGEK